MSLLDAIDNFHLPTLPVIDAAPSNANDALPGLRLLRDELKRDCDLPHQNTNSSTNAPYLIAVWDELVHALQAVAIYRTFPSTDNARSVKVDVVAENGAKWVRINTIKNSRLTREFRELDSYLTSEEEDESRPRLAQTEFDNSVLRMGRDLLAAAKANPISIPGSLSTVTVTPQVTIRLTRLDPLKDDTPDHRIAKTIQCLRNMGIDVQLGERSHSVPIPRPPPTHRPLEPTTNINLDLSALIALISDISHSPLPRTEQEAHARFDPPQSYLDWKKERVESLARQINNSPRSVKDKESNEGIWENSGQHSRALAAQAIQEMNKGILEEIRSRVSTNVTFWTTGEARDRCFQIVSKIGGERERLRADALLGSTLCARTPPMPSPAVARMGDAGLRASTANAYWKHSRYQAGFLPLVPIRVYPSISPSTEDEPPDLTTFFVALARTCSEILSHEAVSPDIPGHLSTPVGNDGLEEIPPAVQTSLPKLTIHTVKSFLAGASRGYTTLTTNRSSVKAALKEVRRLCGRGGYNDPGPVDISENAVLWILDPRSLSEGMRSK